MFSKDESVRKPSRVDDESCYISKLKTCISASRDIIIKEDIDADQTARSDFIHQFSARAKHCEPESDVMANLVCERDESGIWDLRLNEIKGSKVAYLFGKSFNSTETLVLDSLIPRDQQKNHQAYVISILNEGPSSQYWSFLFGGLMSRTIKIMNPHNQTPRLVKINMSIDSNSLLARNRYVFNITLTDQTAINAVATKAGLLTHDLRSYMRAGINTIVKDKAVYTREQFILLSPEELGRVYDLQKEKDAQAVELFNEGLKLSSNTREDFFPDAIIQESMNEYSLDADEVLVDNMLQDFIRKTQAITSECELSYFGGTSSKLGSRKINILEHFLLNLIKNAVQAGARQIDVKSTYEIEALTIEVTDNGSGMPSHLLNTFFTRTMPQRALLQFPRAIEDNRGEGALMANMSWESIGGKSTVMPRQDGQCGTTFQLSIHAPNHRFFTHEACSLSGDQKRSLADLGATEALNGIILLVDDSLVNMKMLFKSVIKSLSTAPLENSGELKSINSDYWQQQGFLIAVRANWGIICAANGRVAYDIVKNLPIKAIITDYEMPIMTGSDLILAIRKLEREESRSRIRIALNTAQSEKELSSTGVLSEIDMLIEKNEHTAMSQFFQK